ncbi:hypothetical protein NSMM_800071 [Nitrosomonas mobilis]|uniref:Uncharacterized protein n=1 Tax=Nitrosomonas mobilis TaxID=51642 RepID=A0A1G5SIQ9_9PROT|nr:hypothetical protein NSMM_800071 [Nitrosomonas mobilis]
MSNLNELAEVEDSKLTLIELLECFRWLTHTNTSTPRLEEIIWRGAYLYYLTKIVENQMS